MKAKKKDELKLEFPDWKLDLPEWGLNIEWNLELTEWEIPSFDWNPFLKFDC